MFNAARVLNRKLKKTPKETYMRLKSGKPRFPRHEDSDRNTIITTHLRAEQLHVPHGKTV